MREISGSILKEERKKQRLSQKQLAEELKVSPAYVNLIENGNRPLTPVLRQQICEILNIPESRILGEGNIAALKRLQQSEYFADHSEEDLRRFVIELPQFVDVFHAIEDQLFQARTTVSRLSDRVGQDDVLNQSLHDLLSIATSIRSTSSILNTQGDLPPQQASRFREVLHQDSRQLSEVLRGLVDYLDTEGQEDAGRISAELRMMQSLEDSQYYIQELEEQSVTLDDLPVWLAQNFGEEVANIGKVRRLFELFIRDIQALPSGLFIEAAKKHNWQIEALSVHFDIAVDRILRRTAMLSSQGDFGSVSLCILDQTGKYLLESLSLSGHRSVELSCPFWPIFDSERERGKLYSKSLYINENETYNAFAASALHSSFVLPQGGWIYRTMLVTRAGHAQKLADVETSAQRIGFNCRDCQILDCGARRNRPISLINNDKTQQQRNKN